MSTTIERCELIDWAVRLVSVQSDVSPADALRLLQNTAEQTDTPLEYVAELVVDGTVSPERPWSRHSVHTSWS
ncbi:MAG: ANTAR domain-containing protein [Acidimicrobiia bacterium]